MSSQTGSEAKGSDSTIDNVIDYLKERIESPFLMSFIFSWSVINRDFLFYLFLSSDNNKHEQLTSWNFSGFIFNSDVIIWYSPWALSFWFPLFYGALMALLFSPVSMLLSGCRYFLLSKVASFTQNNKGHFDLAHTIGVAQKQLKLLDKEVMDRKAKSNAISREIENYRSKVEEAKSEYFSAKLGSVTPFLIKSAQFDARYKLGTFSKDSGIDSEKLLPDCIIKLEIYEVTEGAYLVNPTGKTFSFEGTVFDLFTNKKFFKLDSDVSLESIKKLIKNLTIQTKVRCNLESGSRVNVSLLECKVFSSE